MFSWLRLKSNIDWFLFFLAITMTFLGMLTYYNPENSNAMFWKQFSSLIISLFIYFLVSGIEIRYFKNNNFIISLYILVVILFGVLAILGSAFSGAQSWFSLGLFAFQPTDFAKLVLVLLLAKFFSKRHIQINQIKYLIVSAIYMFVLFLFLLKQPDLGSALIIFSIWFGMIFLFGVKKKYIIYFISLLSIISIFMYSFVLHNYQKKRIDTFLNPESDLLGSGYNIHQAHISLGSGGIFGKGISEGSQSHLDFLPEYETDFIFSAFGEEWGLLGELMLIVIFIVFSFRILQTAYFAHDNFESMLALGILIYFSTHFIFHIGINLGLLPVTGTTLPFLSYGGSHLLVEFLSLGIINSIRRNNLEFNRNNINDTNIF